MWLLAKRLKKTIVTNRTQISTRYSPLTSIWSLVISHGWCANSLFNSFSFCNFGVALSNPFNHSSLPPRAAYSVVKVLTINVQRWRAAAYRSQKQTTANHLLNLKRQRKPCEYKTYNDANIMAHDRCQRADIVEHEIVALDQRHNVGRMDVEVLNKCSNHVVVVFLGLPNW